MSIPTYIHSEVEDTAALATSLLPDEFNFDACVCLYVRAEFAHSYWTPAQARQLAEQLLKAATEAERGWA
jgi:hypothetical protein